MAYRILAVATDKIAKDVVHHLNLRPNSPIDRLIHFGDTDADYKASSLLKMAVIRGSGKRGHIMENDQFSGGSSDLAAVKISAIGCTRQSSICIEHRNIAYNTHKLKDLFDYQHYYHIIVDRLGRLFAVKRSIGTVIRHSAPVLRHGNTQIQ